ncbi:unnamed protein product [Leptosia nina]|uniref:Uncharacterized protein n=1 Tax=Leptosia nina TaxID=320188 RepID=A0AAV1JVI0_9NEOP
MKSPVQVRRKDNKTSSWNCKTSKKFQQGLKQEQNLTNQVRQSNQDFNSYNTQGIGFIEGSKKLETISNGITNYTNDYIQGARNTFEKIKPPKSKSFFNAPNENNNSPKLIYSEKNKHRSKAIFYKDICVTGEKIALWKKLKNNMSSLTSTVNDLKIKLSNQSVTKKNMRAKTKQSIGGNKSTKHVPFYQRIWNYYCKVNSSKIPACPNLPLLQFPDIPNCRSFVNGCCTSAEIIHKLYYSNSCKCVFDADDLDINLPKANSCKVPEGLCQDAHTEISDHKTLKDVSIQCLDQETKAQCTNEIVVEHKCVSSQYYSDKGCGDTIKDLSETCPKSKCFLPFLKKNTGSLRVHGKHLFKRIHKSSRQNKNVRYTQTRVSDNIVNYKNKTCSTVGPKKVKSAGVQITLECNHARNPQLTKKVGVKKILSHKSCSEKPIPLKHETKGTQCSPDKKSKFAEEKDKQKPRTMFWSRKASQDCNCNDFVTVINHKPTKHKKSGKKAPQKPLYPRKKLISICTQCPEKLKDCSNLGRNDKHKVLRRTVSVEKSEYVVTTKKGKSTFKTIGVQCTKARRKVNTNTVYTSKSCNNLLNTSQLLTVGTQRNTIDFVQRRLRLKKRANWSFFNMRSQKLGVVREDLIIIAIKCSRKQYAAFPLNMRIDAGRVLTQNA